MKLKVFTVFHRAIDERLLFDLFEPAEAETYFTLYGVNAIHAEKWITRLDGTTHRAESNVANVLLEYQLPWHDPLIQARGFMEASCYIHVLKNALHESLDYVGVGQYDMRWTEQSAAILRKLNAQSAEHATTAYGLSVGPVINEQGQLHPYAFPKICNWSYLLQSYNRFFKKNWDGKVLINQPFTLWQTYLLPRVQFVDLASWVASLCNEIYPWANQTPYPTHWGHVAGWAERAESLFIAARLAEGQITFEQLHLHHDESIPKKLAISKDHYGSATETP